MGLLRENKDTLMTVLDPFIHDPLVEWEDEKRKLVSLEEVGSNTLTSLHYPGATSESASCPQQIPNRLAHARQDSPEFY
jgi:phosphatidylinositol kinase/protein kinase (PI-3  family)